MNKYANFGKIRATGTKSGLFGYAVETGYHTTTATAGTFYPYTSIFIW